MLSSLVQRKRIDVRVLLWFPVCDAIMMQLLIEITDLHREVEGIINVVSTSSSVISP